MDLFIVKLTRDYNSSLPHSNNAVIRALAEHPAWLSQRQILSGYIPPQFFTYCDSVGLIQDAENTPLLYHWRRNKADKRISPNSNDLQLDDSKFMYSRAIPKTDYLDFHRLNSKTYWWLTDGCAHIQSFRERRARLVRNMH